MSYNETKTFDKAEVEMDKAVQEEKRRKFWGSQFKDLIERVYIVMKDGVAFPIDSQDEKRITLDIGMLDEQLRGIKDKKYSIKEIDTIIHNHFRSPSFTLSDKKQYRRLKQYGFTGKFKMHNHMRKEVYEYKPEAK